MARRRFGFSEGLSGSHHWEFERRFIMGLLERVSTLIRANINDMVDRAEDPEKMIKQVILDMENQYLQVKTQVAVSIADQHMLEKKWRENEDSGKDWMRKAETAVDKSKDDLARAALDRFQTSQRLAESYREQVDDQKAQVETLKGALVKLEKYRITFFEEEVGSSDLAPTHSSSALGSLHLGVCHANDEALAQSPRCPSNGIERHRDVLGVQQA